MCVTQFDPLPLKNPSYAPFFSLVIGPFFPFDLACDSPGGGGGGYFPIKVTGVLVVPFRGLNLLIGTA